MSTPSGGYQNTYGGKWAVRILLECFLVLRRIPSFQTALKIILSSKFRLFILAIDFSWTCLGIFPQGGSLLISCSLACSRSLTPVTHEIVTWMWNTSKSQSLWKRRHFLFTIYHNPKPNGIPDVEQYILINRCICRQIDLRLSYLCLSRYLVRAKASSFALKVHWNKLIEGILMKRGQIYDEILHAWNVSG